MRPNNRPTAQPWEVSADRARELFGVYRQQLRAYADDTSGATAKKAAPVRRAKIVVKDLPEELQRLLDRYEKDHPGTRLKPLQYLSVSSPGEAASSAAVEDLPNDDELVSLIVTETIASVERIVVRSLVLMARRQPSKT